MSKHFGGNIVEEILRDTIKSVAIKYPLPGLTDEEKNELAQRWIHRDAKKAEEEKAKRAELEAARAAVEEDGRKLRLVQVARLSGAVGEYDRWRNGLVIMVAGEEKPGWAIRAAREAQENMDRAELEIKRHFVEESGVYVVETIDPETGETSFDLSGDHHWSLEQMLGEMRERKGYRELVAMLDWPILTEEEVDAASNFLAECVDDMSLRALREAPMDILLASRHILNREKPWGGKTRGLVLKIIDAIERA